uniref:Uncharacterized protein n=1 Tax=Octopus bimaculoides TaxID=37653 RepID=A0A0L8GZP1_OCTBM
MEIKEKKIENGIGKYEMSENNELQSKRRKERKKERRVKESKKKLKREFWKERTKNEEINYEEFRQEFRKLDIFERSKNSEYSQEAPINNKAINMSDFEGNWNICTKL